MDNISTDAALIADDKVVFGLLMTILALVFYTASSQVSLFKRLYAIFPPLLMCYFVPGLFNSFGIIDGAGSTLYDATSNYILPACLVLFTLNLDLKELWKLRTRAGLMFLTGTLGIFLGGPIAVWVVAQFAPEVVAGEGPDAAWRGLATLAGSWIGGGANQAALFRIFEPSSTLFSALITVDVFVAYGWMAILLYGAGKTETINRFFKADSRDVDALTERTEKYRRDNLRIPETKDLIIMLGLAFGITGIAHFFGKEIAFYIAQHAPYLDKFSLTSSYFWVILLATVLGVALSFTPARRLEGAGASKVGTVFLYVLITTIGMQMDVFAILGNPGLFLVGLIWLAFHCLLLLLVGRLIKAPFFYFALGSMGNIGGVASASVTAAAFHPSLVPIGVVLAVFGYAIGTYAGYLCAILMQWVSP